MNGDLLTRMAKDKDFSPEKATDAYWTTVAFMDDALSKSVGGGIGLPDGQVVSQALAAAGVDASHTGVVDNRMLKALMAQHNDGLSTDFQQSGTHNHELLDKLKDKALKKGTKFLAKQGTKFAVKLGAQLAGRVAGALAGEAAGMALAGTIGAAAGPVGMIAGAAVSVGFGIAEVVNYFKGAAKKRRERRDFDHTVSPALEQFGIKSPISF